MLTPIRDNSTDLLNIVNRSINYTINKKIVKAIQASDVLFNILKCIYYLISGVKIENCS